MKSNLTEKWIVCRVCLKQPKETMNTIFDTNDNNDLTQMILECGGVPIKKFDHYPDKICSRCLRYLRVAYKFRVTCQRSHKHLSRFIAPVVVERIAVEANDLISEETDAVELKLEPDSVINIKEEQTELIDDDDIMDMYEPLEIDNVQEFGDIDNVEDFIDCEEINIVDAVITDETEYLDDIVKAETEGEGEGEGEAEYAGNTSDADYVPNEKVKEEKRGRKPINRNEENSLKASTSRGVQKTKTTKAPKREPKRKYKSKECIQYICDICGNIYPSQGRLTEHIKLHKGIKPHVCEICGHAFAQTQQLARHMNTHTGFRPYKCNYCPSAFADLSTRNKHHRIHTNERPYVCDVCGKAFTYTNTLKFHKMIHTGEKPFVCDICGKGFQQSYKLRNHKVTHAKKGITIKIEKIEVEEEMAGYQEDKVATAQLLGI